MSSPSMKPALAAMALAALIGSGPAQPAERVYAPGAFDSIEISGSATVRFVQGPTDQVVVEGDGQKSAVLHLRDGGLRISTSPSWKFWQGERLQLTITAHELKRLSISGSADVTASGPVKVDRLMVDISGSGHVRFDRLTARRLEFDISGSGDAQLSGVADELDVGISGRSQFDAANLKARRAEVSIHGLGDVKVWATEALDAAVAGIGTIDYWGTPTLTRDSSGIGTFNNHGAKAEP